MISSCSSNSLFAFLQQIKEALRMDRIYLHTIRAVLLLPQDNTSKTGEQYPTCHMAIYMINAFEAL